jgi:polyisoprenoid-binding protein YceI
MKPVGASGYMATRCGVYPLELPLGAAHVNDIRGGAMKRVIALAIAVALPVLAAAETSTWTFDPKHSDASFAVKHLVISTVRGHFGKVTGTVQLDEVDVTKSSVEATVDTTTVDTRIADRDRHLKSADFFEVEKYPTMTFKSKKVETKGEGKLAVTGDLTIKATTRPVTFDVDYTPKSIRGPSGDERRGITAVAKISRKEFGVLYSKVVEAGPVVGDEVTIQIDTELIKTAPKGQASAEEKPGDRKG